MTAGLGRPGSGPAAYRRPSGGPAAVLAIDVGNSKTDVALLGADGSVLGAVAGPTSSHQQIGLEPGFAMLVSIVERVMVQAGLDPADRPAARLAVYCAAGVDLPSDERLLASALRRTGLGAADLVVNDCYGGLRAGTSRTWGVCVISGSGINCLGVAPDGRLARFDALGEISGDWGGGEGIGKAALGAAVRAQDGRGPATILAATVPLFFGLSKPRQVTVALYKEKIPLPRVNELAPLVFAAAVGGDAVARSIVDRLADEVVAFATAAIRRLRLQRADTHVVLAGGMFRADDPAFYDRIESGVAAVAPHAVLRRMTAPPVVGAALLGFDRLNGIPAPPELEKRLRAELTHERVAGGR
jgi:N-acetylglucosamine kinase-like BadF-type ATPase